MTDKTLNPVAKQVLELGPPMLFFAAYLWMRDRTYTFGRHRCLPTLTPRVFPPACSGGGFCCGSAGRRWVCISLPSWA